MRSVHFLVTLLCGVTRMDKERLWDAAIFPEWLECAHRVLGDDELDGYANADIKLSPE